MNDAIMPNFSFTGILGGRLSIPNLQLGHRAIKPGVETHPASCHLLRPISGTYCHGIWASNDYKE